MLCKKDVGTAQVAQEPERHRSAGEEVRFAQVASVEALAAFADDVRTRRFPDEAETYHLSAEVAESLSLYGSASGT